MSESQPESSSGTTHEASPEPGPPDCSEDARREDREYTNLRSMLPNLSASPEDLSKKEVVMEAVQHIEDLHQRLARSFVTAQDAAKAQEFLLKRVSEDFEIRHGEIVRKNEPRFDASTPEDKVTELT